MSPIKTSKRNKPYFNVNVETSNNNVYRAVCFSPSKRKIFDEAEQSHYGLSIDHANKKPDGTIFIHDNTNIKMEQLGFHPSYKIPTKTVSEVINEVAVNTSVNVSGHLKLEDASVVSVGGQDVVIRRGYLCDGTGHIKITLWREYSNLKNGCTYVLCEMRKGVYNSRTEIQSTNTTSYKEIEPMDHFSMPDEDPTTAITTTGTFFAVKFFHTTKCVFCNENVNIKTNDNSTTDLIQCLKCDSASLLKLVKAAKYWIGAVNVGSRRIDLTIDSNLLGLDDMSTDQLQIYLLSNEFNFTYDPFSGKVENITVVEKVDIADDDK